MKVYNYIDFINEEFFKSLGKKKPTENRVDKCLSNILSFLKENDINDWNDFLTMGEFDRMVVNRIIDSEVKGFDELKEIRFLIKLELSDTQQLREMLPTYEDNEEYEKCARILKKINKR